MQSDEFKHFTARVRLVDQSQVAGKECGPVEGLLAEVFDLVDLHADREWPIEVLVVLFIGHQKEMPFPKTHNELENLKV